MNTANIKAYAPKARRDFIQAVTEKAHLLGLSDDHVEPVQIKGDVAIIAGRPYPKRIGELRQQLVERINREGFEVVMRAMAYTWFNRFVAIRYMELHDYLDHGFRVLSNRTGSEIPEILEHATDVELPGLNKEEVVRLRLAGDKDNELYQLLVVAQCNALHRAMPFLFERIGGYDELLMPDNLLHSNSPVRHLVNDIPEEDWQQIEIIGWIYQFYIAEKKDEVIGKVVASVDIPAATQLFTPNWIVKYMVQNSLGAQWLATYPNSPLKGQMEYYIEPAEQTDEVKSQLAAITPSTLNPEELTLIDPASGSGHILVEAYELFKAIYLERGYRQRDVAQLILEKNLFGLDIDGRAAQLTGFALMMKGRADDRRLFERDVKLNVMALVDSAGFDAERLAKGVKLADYGLQPSDLTELKRLFEHATTFGSLIQVPEALAKKLPALKQLIEAAGKDLFVSDALKCLGQLVQQAELLSAQYDAVVANPPYMGSKFHVPIVKEFTKRYFPDAKGDLFTCFIERGFTLGFPSGNLSMVTMENWMFLSSYEKFRSAVLQQHTLRTLAHFPYDGKRPTAMGINFGIAVVSALNIHVDSYRAYYCCSRYYELNSDGVPFVFPTPNERLKFVISDEFLKVPGTPLAYWVSDRLREAFVTHEEIAGMGAFTTPGLQTSDNERFLRRWWEPSHPNIGFGCSSNASAVESSMRWFPHPKGGSFRKWYGNDEYVVNWENDGAEIKRYVTDRYPYLNGNIDYVVKDRGYYFQAGVSWSHTTSSRFSARFMPTGSIFNVEAPALFADEDSLLFFLCFLNCSVSIALLGMINSTLHFLAGMVSKLPVGHVVGRSRCRGRQGSGCSFVHK
jgi:hypothetical protein